MSKLKLNPSHLALDYEFTHLKVQQIHEYVPHVPPKRILEYIEETRALTGKVLPI